ncbi:MAG: PstS family phosphate ABC transporter substrate-binding protein [Muribaculaceae bacterium]
MSLKRYAVIAVALLAMAMTSCIHPEKPRNTATSGTSTIFCDNSFENILEQEIDVFEYIYPDAHVLARYGTEAEALDSLLSLNTRTIIIPRELTKQEEKSIKAKNRTPRSAKIAVDAVALIVNNDNPVDYLSMKEISEILSGETSSWVDINPHAPDRPISILFDDAGSGMVKYMRDSLLNGKELGKNVYAQGSISSVVDAVKKDRSAIGVIGVSWLTTDLRKVATIDSIAAEVTDETRAVQMDDINNQVKNSGVKVLGVMRPDDRRAFRPYQENIYDGSYPLTRSIYMITVAHSGSPAGGFYTFVTGYTGQKIIMKTGILPARMQINVVELVQ